MQCTLLHRVQAPESSMLDITADAAIAMLQRFAFTNAGGKAVRHPSVIPVGPRDGMPMLIS